MIVVPFQDQIVVTSDEVNILLTQNTQMDGDCTIYISKHNAKLLIEFLQRECLKND